MFAIRHKQNSKRVVTAYQVKEGGEGVLLLLTFQDGFWSWVAAQDWEPAHAAEKAKGETL